MPALQSLTILSFIMIFPFFHLYHLPRCIFGMIRTSLLSFHLHTVMSSFLLQTISPFFRFFVIITSLGFSFLCNMVIGNFFSKNIQDNTVSYFDKFVKQYLVVCKKRSFSATSYLVVTFFGKFVDLNANYGYTRGYNFRVTYDKYVQLLPKINLKLCGSFALLLYVWHF